MQVPGIEVAGAITFIFILGTILIQAPSTAWLAGKLGLLIDGAHMASIERSPTAADENATTAVTASDQPGFEYQDKQQLTAN
jgi:NhaP-type Na+/H+ or K+/H+ antiporter